MSKEQIEEMAKVIDEFTEPLSARDIHKAEFSELFAEHLYNAGYRKQSENVIELPCKLGTTLYFLYDNPYADKPDLTPRIYESNEWYFDIRNSGVYIKPIYIHGYKGTYHYELGVNVFFTMEEAKMKGGAE